jgi:hypothetical protein
MATHEFGAEEADLRFQNMERLRAYPPIEIIGDITNDNGDDDAEGNERNSERTFCRKLAERIGEIEEEEGENENGLLSDQKIQIKEQLMQMQVRQGCD